MTAETPALDRRRNAYRADLAAETLRGTIAAPRFAAGEARQIVDAAVPLRAAPLRRLRRLPAGLGAIRARAAADPLGACARYLALPDAGLQVAAEPGAQHECGRLCGGDGRRLCQARRRPFRAPVPHRRTPQLRARFCRPSRRLSRRALRLGRQDAARGRLLGLAATCPPRVGSVLPARQRYAAGGGR